MTISIQIRKKLSFLTGRKVNQHIGGGTKFDYFMIDFHRRGPKEPDATYDERVTIS